MSKSKIKKGNFDPKRSIKHLNCICIQHPLEKPYELDLVLADNDIYLLNPSHDLVESIAGSSIKKIYCEDLLKLKRWISSTKTGLFGVLEYLISKTKKIKSSFLILEYESENDVNTIIFEYEGSNANKKAESDRNKLLANLTVPFAFE